VIDPDPATEVAGRELTLADRDWLTSRLPAALRPPAEYAFANLYLFRARHRYRIVTGEVPHLSGITYDGLRHALPLAPLDRAGADALLADHDCLFPFGGDGPGLAQALGLACRSHDADSDYVYDAARIAKLSGSKARRAQARAFELEQSPSVHPITRETGAELEHVVAGWIADIGRDATSTDLAECREAIAMAASLGLDGALVRTGAGEPVAFLLASRRADGEHIVHFAKARRAHSGAYPWMFARYAETSGAGRLNFEQDLGNPGFAQSKRSYGPIERRPKYRIAHG
jgi:hypothetical protein